MGTPHTVWISIPSRACSLWSSSSPREVSQVIPLGILNPPAKTNPFLGCQKILQQEEPTELQTLLDKSVLRHFKKHSAFFGEQGKSSLN